MHFNSFLDIVVEVYHTDPRHSHTRGGGELFGKIIDDGGQEYYATFEKDLQLLYTRRFSEQFVEYSFEKIHKRLIQKCIDG